MISYGFEENTEVTEATAQVDNEAMAKRLQDLIAESPSRQRARFIPDFTQSKEYQDLLAVDTSTMSGAEKDAHAKKLLFIQSHGTYTDEERQAEIDTSLSTPLSNSVSTRDELRAQIEKIEGKITNFDVSEAQAKVDALEADYKHRANRVSGISRAVIQSEYQKAVDEIEQEYVNKPLNTLKLERYRLIERYKVYDNRIKLYVSANKDAIQRAIDRARDAEIDENLLALAEYMEG